MEPLIKCEHVDLGYENQDAVINVNMEVWPGDYLCIVGENGSGKSTLIKGLLGLLKPSGGKLTVAEELKTTGIGYLPQQTAAQKDFPASVREVVLSGCLSRRGRRPFYSKTEKDIASANMEKLGMSYFDKTPAGSIVSRLTNDTETISEMFSGTLSSFISAIFIFVTTLYTMMILDIRLTGLIVLFLPLIVLLVNLYRKKSVAIIEKTRALLSDINAKLSESIEGIHIIQAFNQEKRLKKEFDAINEEHLIYASRSISLDSLFLRPAMSLLKLLAYAVLMAYFGYRGRYHVCLYPVY